MNVRTESKTGSFPYWFNKKRIVGFIVMSGCTGSITVSGRLVDRGVWGGDGGCDVGRGG